jgi:hypothetical protein
MMRPGVQVAGRVDVQIEETMAGHQLEHVVEEAQAGADRGPAGTVEIDAYEYLGFPGRPLDRCHSLPVWLIRRTL